MSDFQHLPIGDMVLYKNNQLIAFNKTPGYPVQQDNTKDKSLHALGEIYTQSKLFVIHRIDRPASGIVLFAKNAKALAHLNEQFRERQIGKVYLAVVGEHPPQKEGTLIHYLRKDGQKNVSRAYAEDQENTKRAELNYQYLAGSERYHLLRIELATGRHHQIRAQLAAIGCPIKGDVKYGFRRANPDRSIHLHAWQLDFRHPITGETVHLQAAPPANDPVWQAFQEQGIFMDDV